MPRKSDRDPLESAMERALRPGEFIAYGAGWSFVDGLRDVEAKLAALRSSEPVRIVTLYETFIAGCYEKAEELDDSSGGFGGFGGSLFCGWIAARQSAKADGAETARLLLARMDEDDHGFCYKLETEAVKVLDRTGRDALELVLRQRLESTVEASADTSAGRDANYARRRAVEILKALYIEGRKPDAYVELSEKTGTKPDDCLAIAELVKGRGAEEALGWVEKGLALQKTSPFGSSSGRLEDLKRALLEKLGRGHEALDSAWTEFCAHPGKFTFDELMKYVTDSERSRWHEKAMTLAAEKADLGSLIELWLEVGEIDRLVERLRRASHAELEGISHYRTEPAAERLAKKHPAIAAKVNRALGLRVLNAKKSKYYDAALRNFEAAQRLYAAAGEVAEWEALVALVRREHTRKSGFMGGFEKLLAGHGPTAEPSFLERAKKRWSPEL